MCEELYKNGEAFCVCGGSFVFGQLRVSVSVSGSRFRFLFRFRLVICKI